MADRYERDRYDRERSDRERGYGREDRGMIDRAGDEVRSWFGDEDAARRRDRDERESYRGRESDREYGRASGQDLGRPQGASDPGARGWSGGYGDRWRESRSDAGRSPEDWRPRQDWNMAASRPARLESSSQFQGSNDSGSPYGGRTYSGGYGDYDQGGQAFREGDRRYGGGSSREGGFQSSRVNAGGSARDYPAWNYQNIGSAASDYGAIGRSAGWAESRGQFTGRGPKGYQRSDERIREDVCDRLSDDPHLDASDIEITVRNGEVTLAGSVRERSDKRHAEDVVEQVSGVREVTNSLRVNRGSTNPGDVIGLNSEKGSGPITKS